MALTAISPNPHHPHCLLWPLSLCGFTPDRSLWSVLLGFNACGLHICLPCFRTLLESKMSLSAKSDLSQFHGLIRTHLRFRDIRAGKDPNRAHCPAPFHREVRQGSYFKRNTWRPGRLRNSEVLPPRIIFVLTSLPHVKIQVQLNSLPYLFVWKTRGEAL